MLGSLGVVQCCIWFLRASSLENFHRRSSLFSSCLFFLCFSLFKNKNPHETLCLETVIFLIFHSSVNLIFFISDTTWIPQLPMSSIWVNWSVAAWHPFSPPSNSTKTYTTHNDFNSFTCDMNEILIWIVCGAAADRKETSENLKSAKIFFISLFRSY
jgi:hypothetical protein